jgi:nucleoside-diphosphate-sugar epimerase
MNVLIIGGTGNISTGITRELLKKGGCDITLFNNDKTDMWEGKTKRIVGDRNKYDEFEKTFKNTGPWDCVLDMICYKPQDAECMVRTFKGKTKQLVFTSTVDAFTKPARSYPVPVDGERKPDPAFDYAYKKAQCEFIFEEAHKKGDFNLTIIRCVATYNDTWLPITFGAPINGYVINRIIKGQPIIQLGDGNSIWVSTHRDDVAVAFAGAIGNPKTYGKMYVTSGDEYLCWNEYFQTIARVLDAPPVKFAHIPSKLIARMVKACDWCDLNFQYSNIFDNAPAKQDLGFRYTITWEQGVRRIMSNPKSKEILQKAGDYPLYDKIIAAWTKCEEQAVAACREMGLN